MCLYLFGVWDIENQNWVWEKKVMIDETLKLKVKYSNYEKITIIYRGNLKIKYVKKMNIW